MVQENSKISGGGSHPKINGARPKPTTTHHARFSLQAKRIIARVCHSVNLTKVGGVRHFGTPVDGIHRLAMGSPLRGLGMGSRRILSDGLPQNNIFNTLEGARVDLEHSRRYNGPQRNQPIRRTYEHSAFGRGCH